MEQKIAVLSDSHGNSTALQAAIEDARAQGATEFWTLGDIAFGGATSEECLQLLDQVNLTQVLMGNWESDFNLEMAHPNWDLSDPTNVYFTMLVKYENEHLSAKHRQQLVHLPMSGRKQVGDLLFSLSHNLPGQNHGHSLYPTQPQANFDQLALDSAIDVAIYAHIHSPLWRYSDQGQIILNPGAVGRPWNTRAKLLQNRAASYLLLTVNDTGLAKVDFRRAAYDLNIELQKGRDRGFPYVDLEQKQLLTGHSSTHNTALLAEINAKRGYDKLAAKYLNELKEQTRAAQ